MVEVEVVVQTLAEGAAEFQELGPRIVVDLVREAGFDATEDGDQAAGSGLAGGRQPADEIFLAQGAGGEVMDAPGGGVEGEPLAGALDPLTEVLHELAEVLEQDAGGPEDRGQPLDVGEAKEGADEAKSVESAEGPLNALVMSG
jgi:hypothetical protein